MQTQFYLLEDADATGNGEAIPWAGGEGFLGVKGTFGGTSFTFEYSPDANVWFPSTIDAITADESVIFKLPRGYIRGVLTGGTDMSVTAYIRGV